jgi:hypothetical protein
MFEFREHGQHQLAGWRIEDLGNMARSVFVAEKTCSSSVKPNPISPCDLLTLTYCADLLRDQPPDLLPFHRRSSPGNVRIPPEKFTPG